MAVLEKKQFNVEAKQDFICREKSRVQKHK
jgi:hypothetical protein